MERNKILHSCESIPANQESIEALYDRGIINQEARQYALDLLYPANKWGFWVERLLLAIGIALTLCGIFYFLNLNWQKIQPIQKLFMVEAGMVLCFLGAAFCSLKKLNGQVLLLCGNLLLGVFLGVFGWNYNSGAKLYELFMNWSLLTLGWTLISYSVIQWLFWLILTNSFLFLWWGETDGFVNTIFMDIAPLSGAKSVSLSMICVVAAALNGTVLALREYCISKKMCKWCEGSWVRLLLLTVTLLALFYSVNFFITFDLFKGIYSGLVPISALIGLLGHGIAYYFYRYRFPDIRALTLIILSICMTVEVLSARVIEKFLSLEWTGSCQYLIPFKGSIGFFLMGFITLATFTCAILGLKKLSKQIGKRPSSICDQNESQ